MAVQLYYVVDAAASGSSHGRLQYTLTPTISPNPGTTTTGFKVAKNGATLYCLMAYATANNTTFGSTALPSAAPASPFTDCFRWELPAGMTIPTGAWVVKLSCIAVGTAATGTGRFRVRIWRSTNANGSGATEITSTTLLTSSYSNLTTSTAQNLTVTSGSLTGFTTGTTEYIFMQVACETQTASGSSNANVTLRVDTTNSRLELPNGVTFLPIANDSGSTVTDSAAFVMSFDRVFSDTADVTESVVRELTIASAPSTDSASVTDSVTWDRVLGRVASDAALVHDTPDPAEIALTWWNEAPFSSGTTWTAKTSAGTSDAAGKGLVTEANAPSNGTAINGLTPPQFTAASSQALNTSGAFGESLVPVDGYDLLFLFYADSAPSPAANIYDDPALASVSGGWSVRFNSNGLGVAHYDGAWKGGHLECSADAWHLGRVKYDGGASTLSISIDAGPLVVVSSSVTDLTMATGSTGLFVGKSILNVAAYFDGRIAAILAKAAFSAAEFAAVVAYLDDRYQLGFKAAAPPRADLRGRRHRWLADYTTTDRVTWHDDVTGDAAFDLVPDTAGHTPDVVSSPAAAVAMSFQGSDYAITSGGADAPGGCQAALVGAFFHLGASDGIAGQFSIKLSGGLAAVSLYGGYDSGFGGGYLGANVGGHIAETATPLSAGWHVAVVDVQPDGDVRLYVDGAFDSAANVPGGVPWEQVTGYEVYGTYPDSSGAVGGVVVEYTTESFAEDTDAAALSAELAVYIASSGGLIESSASDSASVTDAAARELVLDRVLSVDSVSVTEAATEELVLDRVVATDSASVADAGARELVLDRVFATDSAAVTDSASDAFELERLPSDSATSTDSVTRDGTWVRDSADSASLAESAAGELTLDRALSVDSVTATDSGSRELTFDRVLAVDSVVETESTTSTLVLDRSPATDTVSVAELAAREIVLDRVLATDTISVTEAVVRDGTWARDSNDAISVTEAVVRDGTWARDSNDAATVSDTATRDGTWIRESNDAATAVEAVVRDGTWSRLHGPDAASIIDEVTAEVAAELTFFDTPSVSDSAAATVSIERASVDTASATESTSSGLIEDRFASDAAAATEAAARELSLERSAATDAAAITDATTRDQTLARAASDTASSSDSVSTERELEFTAVDAVDADFDDASFALDAAREAADAASVADDWSADITSGASLNPVLNDAASVADDAARDADLVRPIEDSVDVEDVGLLETIVDAYEFYELVAGDDVVFFVLDGGRVATDSVAATDSGTASSIEDRFAQDVVAVSDAVAATVHAERAASDSCAVADTIERAKDTVRFANDAVDVTDQADGVSGAVEVHFVDDSAPATDQVLRASSPSRRATDALVLVDDSAIYTVVRERRASDVAGVIESVVVVKDLGRARSDTVLAPDVAVREVTFARSAAGAAIEVEDVAVATVSASRATSVDPASISDSASTALAYSRARSDSVLVTDAQPRSLALGRAANDNASAVDSLVRVLTFARANADAADVTEASAVALSLARSRADAAVTADTAARGMEIGRIVQDVVATIDVAAKMRSVERAVDDVADTDDASGAGFLIEASLSDLVGASDEATPSGRILARVVEDLAFLDDSVRLHGVLVVEMSASRVSATEVFVASVSSASATPARVGGGRA